MTDAEAIARSLRHLSAFEVVFERHFTAVFRYRRRRVGSAADDLTAETVTRAFAGRGGYDLTRPDARPWLFGIATNVLRAHHRDAYAPVAVAERDVVIDADDRLDAAARLARHAALLRALPVEQRAHTSRDGGSPRKRSSREAFRGHPHNAAPRCRASHGIARWLLAGAPLDAAQRSALFDVAAGIDGVRVSADALDRLGRRGTAVRLQARIELNAARPPYRKLPTTRAVSLVFDPATGPLLGTRFTLADAGGRTVGDYGAVYTAEVRRRAA